MTQPSLLPDLWDTPALRSERAQRRKSRRRTLSPVEPLASPSEPATFADAVLQEHQAALSCHRRAMTNLTQAVERGAGPDEQQLLADVLEAADRRLAHNRARLIRALQNCHKESF